MVIIMAEGGPGSTKTMFLVYTAKVAMKGGINWMLRRKYRTPYKIIANLALYFCHPPKVQIDHTGLVTYLPGCDCPAAQIGGTLNPMELVDRYLEDRSLGNFTAPYTSIVGHEWHDWSEARLTAILPKKSKIKRIMMSHLYDQTRKRHLDFELDTQSRDKVDNRLRDFANYLAICQNMAADKENDIPDPYYDIWIDPFTRAPQEFEYYPGRNWAKMLMPQYNTWEIPPYTTEAEIAMDEYEKEKEYARDRMRLDKAKFEEATGRKLEPENEERDPDRARRRFERLQRLKRMEDKGRRILN